MSILVQHAGQYTFSSGAVPTRVPRIRARIAVAKRIAGTVALLVLGTACAAGAVLFLLSVGIAMPVLTEQVGHLIASGQWNVMPLATTMASAGYTPQFDHAVTGWVTQWLLSCETGSLISLAAGAFGALVWAMEIVRARLTSWSSPRDQPRISRR